jgi:hypothetical protein
MTCSVCPEWGVQFIKEYQKVLTELEISEKVRVFGKK